MNSMAVMNKNDLDSSNVLYDEDFEINEEEGVDSSRDVHFNDNAPASTLFGNNDWVKVEELLYSLYYKKVIILAKVPPGRHLNINMSSINLIMTEYYDHTYLIKIHYLIVKKVKIKLF